MCTLLFHLSNDLKNVEGRMQDYVLIQLSHNTQEIIAKEAGKDLVNIVDIEVRPSDDEEASIPNLLGEK